MWCFGISFALMWGSIALRTYRTRRLIANKVTSLHDMQRLSDNRLLLLLTLIVIVEALTLSLYSFAGQPTYVDEGCGIFCYSNASNHVVYWLLGGYHLGLLGFSAVQVTGIRHLTHRGTGRRSFALAPPQAALQSALTKGIRCMGSFKLNRTKKLVFEFTVLNSYLATLHTCSRCLHWSRICHTCAKIASSMAQ